MSVIKDSAVILARLDYSETSQVLVLFTREHGKIRAIAKGIKRGTKTRFATGVDLLEIGTAAVAMHKEGSQGLSTLTEWKQTRNLSGLREDLVRLYAAQYAAEITAKLTEDEDPHPRSFDALLKTLIALNDQKETRSYPKTPLPYQGRGVGEGSGIASTEKGDPFAELISFQRNLLDEIGSLPRFDACVVCGKNDHLIYFSSQQGGLLCRRCEAGQAEKRELSPATVKNLQSAIPKAPLRGTFVTLDYHIANLIGKETTLGLKLVSRSQRRLLE